MLREKINVNAEFLINEMSNDGKGGLVMKYITFPSSINYKYSKCT